MNGELAAVIGLIHRTHDRDLSVYDESFLANCLTKRRGASGISDAAAYYQYLATDTAEADALVQSLNITYSEFFRNPLTFAVLEQMVLPTLYEDRERFGRSELRIWSAGCADGQEAYSVAILLAELAAARGPQALPFRIFATDICETALTAARQGTYDAAAVQQVRLGLLQRYFTHTGNTYTVAAALRERIDFGVYDLRDEHSASPPASVYGDFDLVLCSNVLLYYRPEIRQFMVNKVRRGLRPDGWLVVGEAERAFLAQTASLQPVAPPAAVFRNLHRSR